MPLGAAAVIRDAAGRVLLVRHGYGERNWEIPGGAGEPRESALETALREAREEVGVDLIVEGIAGIYWEPGWRDGEGGHHFVFRARLAADVAPRLADPKEIIDLGWFGRDALPRPMSDFTVRRIDDAMSSGPTVFGTVSGRRWVR